MEEKQQIEQKNDQNLSSKKKINWKELGKKILNYVIKTTNGMAYGLFATLIVGTIIKQIGQLSNVDFIINIGSILQGLMAPGIGCGIALALKLEPLPVIAATAVGALSASISFTGGKANNNPLLIYFAVIAAIEIYRLIFKKKTPVDILLIPFFMIIIGYAVGCALEFPLNQIIYGIQWLINTATEYAPIPMGIVIAVIMGMALTAPISSAAIAIALSLGGIPGGAAVVGCSVQMIGFAVQSIRDNNIGKVISIGIGTSMLQFKNILKKPVIWLPTILTSAILGPISTAVFKMISTPAGAGMGTCGLVGQLGTLESMGYNNPMAYIGILVLHFIAPIILVFLFDLLFRKLGIIKKGDFEI